MAAASPHGMLWVTMGLLGRQLTTRTRARAPADRILLGPLRRCGLKEWLRGARASRPPGRNTGTACFFAEFPFVLVPRTRSSHTSCRKAVANFGIGTLVPVASTSPRHRKFPSRRALGELIRVAMLALAHASFFVPRASEAFASKRFALRQPLRAHKTGVPHRGNVGRAGALFSSNKEHRFSCSDELVWRRQCSRV